MVLEYKSTSEPVPPTAGARLLQVGLLSDGELVARHAKSMVLNSKSMSKPVPSSSRGTAASDCWWKQCKEGRPCSVVQCLSDGEHLAGHVKNAIIYDKG
eukprot:scaffold96389_cov17-Tisochrysis_lutea.AAC.2